MGFPPRRSCAAAAAYAEVGSLDDDRALVCGCSGCGCSGCGCCFSGGCLSTLKSCLSLNKRGCGGMAPSRLGWRVKRAACGGICISSTLCREPCRGCVAMVGLAAGLGAKVAMVA